MAFPAGCYPKTQKPLSVPFVGALDDFTALLTGVWSVVRLLLTSYTGPLVRLRRVSDSVEMDFYPLANGRVDEAGIVTFKGASSLVVVYVYDQYASNNWTQASGAMQPAWVEGLSEFNNAPAMYLGSAAGMENLLSVTKPYSILLTECNPDAATTPGARTLEQGGAYDGNNRFISSSRNTNAQAFEGSAIAPVLQTATAVCEVLTAPSSGNFTFYNNAVDATTASIASQNWSRMALGKSGVFSEYAKSNVAEIVTFNTDLSGAQVTTMQAIFNPATL